MFSWTDGRIYTGEWLDGKQDGYGEYTNTAKELKHGIWKEGKRLNWISDNQYDEYMEKRNATLEE